MAAPEHKFSDLDLGCLLIHFIYVAGSILVNGVKVTDLRQINGITVLALEKEITE